MIIIASTDADKAVAYGFLREHGVMLGMSDDFNALGRLGADGKLMGVVAFNSFNGKLCSMHCAGNGNWVSRAFIKAVFHYPFITCGKNYITITVAGDNLKSVKFVRHMGFRVMHRLRDGWDDGVDTVVLMMTRQECRWLPQEKQDDRKTA